ncbi:hypothetical protein D3C87_1984100 [compost metagenome]
MRLGESVAKVELTDLAPILRAAGTQRTPDGAMALRVLTPQTLPTGLTQLGPRRLGLMTTPGAPLIELDLTDAQ